MEVIVTGGRDYSDVEKIRQVLNLLDVDLLIHGACSGADTLAKEWGDYHGVKQHSFPVTEAEWNKIGKSAGPIRNIRMLEAYPNAVLVAFPGGKGTANCITEAKKRGHLILVIP